MVNRGTARTWVRFGLVLFAVFVHSGFSPGSPIFFHIFATLGKAYYGQCDSSTVLANMRDYVANHGHDPDHWEALLSVNNTRMHDMLAALQDPLECDHQFFPMARLMSFTYMLSTLMLCVAYVLVDRYGTRFMALLGAMLNILGHMMAMTGFGEALMGSDMTHTLYIAAFLSETGARLVGAALQGFVWHVDGYRLPAFVGIALMYNLQGLTGKWFASLLDSGEFYYYFLIILPLGAVILGICVPSRREYKEVAGECLEQQFPDWDFSKTKIDHIKHMFDEVSQIIRKRDKTNKIFVVTVSFLTSWTYLLRVFASPISYDYFVNPLADNIMSGAKAGHYDELAGRIHYLLVLSGDSTLFALFVFAFGGMLGMIGGQILMERNGMKHCVDLLIYVQVIAYLSFNFTWFSTGEIVSRLCAGITVAGSYVLVAKHAALYAPHQAYAPVVLALTFLIALGTFVVVFVGLFLAGTGQLAPKGCPAGYLPIHYCGPGGISSVAHKLILVSFCLTIYYRLNMENIMGVVTPGEPHADEELHACKIIGCRTYEEVLHVTGMDDPSELYSRSRGEKETEKERKKREGSEAKEREKALENCRQMMLDLLRKGHPRDKLSVVFKLRPDRYDDQLMTRSKEEILQMIKEGLIWETAVDADKTYFREVMTGGFAMAPHLWLQFWNKDEYKTWVKMRGSVSAEAQRLQRERDKVLPFDYDLDPLLLEQDKGKGSSKAKYQEDEEGLEPDDDDDDDDDDDSDAGTSKKPDIGNMEKRMKDITRSLSARRHTKELLKLLRQEDKALLQDWLMKSNVDSIAAAVWDMGAWDKAMMKSAAAKGEREPVRMTEMFHAAFPLDSLLTAMEERPDLLPVIVTYLTQLLEKAQRTLEPPRLVAKIRRVSIYPEYLFGASG